MITAVDILRYKQSEMIHVNENTTIHDAVKLMVEKKIGAVVVTRGDTIVGLWTERDLMMHSINDDFSLKTARIGDYIDSNLNVIAYDTPLEAIQERFVGLYIRHVFVEKNGAIIGLISCGDAMEAGLHFKTREMEKLNSMVSLDYYENWSRPKSTP
ncbi:CBS domain-containing protein [Desulfatiferula olefinivorans]